KAAGLVLELADAAHVLDAVCPGLDMAVHHRRRGRHAESVRVTHDIEPFLRLRLLRRDYVANAVDEDLAAAARDRVEARVAQARARLPEPGLASARDGLDLGR